MGYVGDVRGGVKPRPPSGLGLLSATVRGVIESRMGTNLDGWFFEGLPRLDGFRRRPWTGIGP